MHCSNSELMLRLIVYSHSKIGCSLRELPIERTTSKLMQIKLSIHIHHVANWLGYYDFRLLIIEWPIPYRQDTYREIHIKLSRYPTLPKLLRELITCLKIRQHHLHFLSKNRTTFRLQTRNHYLLGIEVTPPIHNQSLRKRSTIEALKYILIRQITKYLDRAIYFIFHLLIIHRASKPPE